MAILTSLLNLTFGNLTGHLRCLHIPEPSHVLSFLKINTFCHYSCHRCIFRACRLERSYIFSGIFIFMHSFRMCNSVSFFDRQWEGQVSLSGSLVPALTLLLSGRSPLTAPSLSDHQQCSTTFLSLHLSYLPI